MPPLSADNQAANPKEAWILWGMASSSGLVFANVLIPWAGSRVYGEWSKVLDW